MYQEAGKWWEREMPTLEEMKERGRPFTGSRDEGRLHCHPFAAPAYAGQFDGLPRYSQSDSGLF